jgi:hypothetical protein
MNWNEFIECVISICHRQRNEMFKSSLILIMTFFQEI